MAFKCVLLSAVALRILFFSVLPSLFDLGTDILNALDMILTSNKIHVNCGSVFLETFINICKDKDTVALKDMGNSAMEKDTLGYISLGIVFLPGIVKALNVLATHLQNGEYRKAPMAICYLPYPLYIICIQMRAIARPLDPKAEQSLIRALSMEAFYESFPQLVLQTISLIYSYQLTLIQAASIAFSLLMLAKTVILLDSAQPIRVESKTKVKKSDDNLNIEVENKIDEQEENKLIVVEKDIEKSKEEVNRCETIERNSDNDDQEKDKNDDRQSNPSYKVVDVNEQKSDLSKYETRGCCTTALLALLSALKYMIWVLPLYLTSIIYKIAAFSIAFSYLRVWAFITMGLLIIELLVMAKYTGFNDFASRIYPVFSNFFIVNIGGAHIRQKEIMNKQEIKNHAIHYNNMYKFAKRSVTVSFLHHTTVLILIALLVVNSGKVDEMQKDKETCRPKTVNQTYNCTGTKSCANNVFQSTVSGLTVHWFEMQDWLYPFCKCPYCQWTEKDIPSTNNKTVIIEELDKLCRGRCTKIEESTKQYQFMITISSVILIGLINLILSTYSARDIKAKNKMYLGETSENEHDRENGKANMNERLGGYRIFLDNDYISTKNDEMVIKIKLLSDHEHKVPTAEKKDVLRVSKSFKNDIFSYKPY